MGAAKKIKRGAATLLSMKCLINIDVNKEKKNFTRL